MKERPILMSGEMVRAILEGRKTQTRRVIKPQPYLCEKKGMVWKGSAHGLSFNGEKETIRNFYKGLQKTNTVTNGKKRWQFCPYGKVGDRLWVRETWYPCKHVTINEEKQALYRATYEAPKNFPTFLPSWKPSIHMPRWASRILLEITNIRVERLNDISEEDALAEGVIVDSVVKNLIHSKTWRKDATINAFMRLWESINGEGSWGANPWVWVIEFKVVKP